jgi:hypothetical protein
MTTKSQELNLLICRFKAQKTDFKTLIFSINKRYRKILFDGINAEKTARNKYLKSNGFNRYRSALFEAGKQIKNIVEPELNFERHEKNS